MSITAKELANLLNISEAAVSMALNGKPGVSTETRNLIIKTAQDYSYDFTKIKKKNYSAKTITLIMFRKHGAIVNDSPFFNTLSYSVEEACKTFGYRLDIKYVNDNENVEKQLNKILTTDCVGVILLGTEMRKEDFFPFAYINLPIVILDTYFNSSKMDCVLINNVDGAYQATNYLIKKRQTQPGYLHSSYSIYNFEERAEGFYKAIRANGMSAAKSIVHLLPPSLEGAYSDMKELIENNEELADCYFADHDLIAAGAMKAFKEKGYRIPEDIGIIGFDNVEMCKFLDPSLTSVNVPIKYMGFTAVNRLLSVIGSEKFYPLKIEMSTNLIMRNSV